MNKDNKKTSFRADIFSFLSLYLFILIFFVIITNIIASQDKPDSIKIFLTQIKKFNNHNHGIETNSNSTDIYANKSGTIDQTIQFIKQPDLSKKLSWDEVIDDTDNYNKYFKEVVEATIEYIKNNNTDNEKLLFVISSKTNDKLKYERASKLITFMSSLQEKNYLIKFDNTDPGNYIYIQVATNFSS